MLVGRLLIHSQSIANNDEPLRAEHSAGQAVSSTMLPVYDDAVHRRPLVPLNPALFANNNNICTAIT